MPTHVTESTGASITATWEFTTGTLTVSPTATFKADVISETTASAGVTVDGVLLKDGTVGIAYGGTGATTAAASRTALGAAASGVNSDITSFNGLTSPVATSLGGTSVTSFTSGGVMYGNGTGAVQVTAAGTSSHVLSASAGGLPVWVPQVEYIAVVCNAPATTNTEVSDVARFDFPFSGYINQAVAGVSTAPTGTTFSVDVRNGTLSFFSTKLWINGGATTSRTSTTPTVINTATSNFSAWDTCRVHIDSDGIISKGLWVTLVCVRTD